MTKHSPGKDAAAGAQHVRDATSHATATVKDTAGQILHAVRDKTPDPVADVAARTGHQIAKTASDLAGTVKDNTPRAVTDPAERAVGAAQDRRVQAAVVAVLVVAAVMYRARSRR
ncbi:hypothetical protein OG216_01795 [Streptomycetaceae bacterium NBC_01309]